MHLGGTSLVEAGGKPERVSRVGQVSVLSLSSRSGATGCIPGSFGGCSEVVTEKCGERESWKQGVWLVCSLEGERERAGQARKCTRWMPRHRPARKDVASCEKLRGAASGLGSGDIRMGKPGWGDSVTPKGEPTRGTETSKYPEEEKSNEIP